MTRIDSTGVAAVADSFFWQPMDTVPPGAKVLLLGGGGSAIIGIGSHRDTFSVAWAPLPKRAPGVNYVPYGAAGGANVIVR
jgi:hypothetical protein